MRRLRDDLYYDLLASSWPRLLTLLAATFLAVNAIFALAYLAVPGSVENARPGSFADAFFFSVQTMGTVGYGRLAPGTAWSNVLVTVEVIIGVLGLAMVTGLVFAKFSRVTARVVFSRVAVVTRQLKVGRSTTPVVSSPAASSAPTH